VPLTRRGLDQFWYWWWQTGKIVGLRGPQGIICEIGDAFAPAKLT
jgi:hypothetical protein